MKKLFSLIMLGFLIVSCSGKEAESNNKISIFAMHNGRTLDPEWPVFKKAQELTNTELESVASKNEVNEIQAYNLMLASSKLPDIVSFVELPRLEDLGREGGLIDLTDLIEKNAPNIKKFFEEYPYFKKFAVANDGKIYTIPQYYDIDTIGTSLGYFIRKDWLKKLNLEEPKSVEDLEKVLYKFKENDLNNNGKNDEVPLFIRGTGIKAILTGLVDMFKAPVSFEARNGKIFFGPSTENYKIAMKKLAKWYKDGIIDKEIFTRQSKARDYMLFNNLGGFTADWIASTSSFNGKLNEQIPGFDFSIILPPTFNGHNETYYSRSAFVGGWGISKDAKDPVKVIKFMDFWYSPEGRRLWNYGIEGEDYKVVDGKPVFTDKVMNDPQGQSPLKILSNSGAQFRLGVFQDANYEFAFSSDDAIKGIKLYMDSNIINPSLPALKLSKEDLSDFVKIQIALQQYVSEKSQAWILGTSSVDEDWEQYIKRLNDIGLQKALKIEQDAYDKFLGQK